MEILSVVSHKIVGKVGFLSPLSQVCCVFVSWFTCGQQCYCLLCMCSLGTTVHWFWDQSFLCCCIQAPQILLSSTSSGSTFKTIVVSGLHLEAALVFFYLSSSAHLSMKILLMVSIGFDVYQWNSPGYLGGMLLYTSTRFSLGWDTFLTPST